MSMNLDRRRQKRERERKTDHNGCVCALGTCFPCRLEWCWRSLDTGASLMAFPAGINQNAPSFPEKLVKHLSWNIWEADRVLVLQWSGYKCHQSLFPGIPRTSRSQSENIQLSVKIHSDPLSYNCHRPISSQRSVKVKRNTVKSFWAAH